MGDTPDSSETTGWPIEIRPNGTVIYDGIAIGGLDLTDTDVGGKGCDECEFPRLTLDLGWCKAAGLRVLIKADPAVDRKRGGIFLER